MAKKPALAACVQGTNVRSMSERALGASAEARHRRGWPAATPGVGGDSPLGMASHAVVVPSQGLNQRMCPRAWLFGRPFRSMNPSLGRARLEKALGVRLPDWHESLGVCLGSLAAGLAEMQT